MKGLSEQVRIFRAFARPWPEGAEGLKHRDHRKMVGGMWDRIGRLQFDFLRERGLTPDHVLLDIGCGCFRAGRFFVDYLNEGNYLGIEKQNELVEAGKRDELGEDLVGRKKPQLIVSDSFEFHKFTKSPDFVIAQSVFTHLDPTDIRKCLTRLAEAFGSDMEFFATFQIPSGKTHRIIQSLFRSHSSRPFRYSVSEMEDFGRKAGWRAEYIGDWGHPRGQKMMRFVR